MSKREEKGVGCVCPTPCGICRCAEGQYTPDVVVPEDDYQDVGEEKEVIVPEDDDQDADDGGPDGG